VATPIIVAPSVIAPAVVSVPIITVTPSAMKPWPGPYKHPACKIVRPVVAVRCAGVRGVIIVAINTIGRRPDVSWSYTKLNSDLGMSSTSRHEYQKPDHNHVF
jgi:hypothetical protein